MSEAQHLIDRFMRYVAVSTQSNSKAATVPSNPNEIKLAEILAKELTAMGFTDVEISEFGCLTGKLSSNLSSGQTAPAIGWCAHLDTVDCGLSPEIHPHLVKEYDGGDICLNSEKDIWLKKAEHPELAPYVGDDILVSDGTSVLGADNKSGVAVVMEALSTVTRENRPHGDIYVAFVPDEEIGLKGSKKLDRSKFPVDFAYTVDGGELGEVVYETFNAAEAVVTIRGISAHPMNSKGFLVNPVFVAHDFIALLDRTSTPECTEGREGFIHPKSVVAGATDALIRLNIRDHDKARFEEKKAFLKEALSFLKVRHPRAQMTLSITDTYANIADAITPEKRAAVELLIGAVKDLNLPLNTVAMRGGTDGSYLSSCGIPTPNYFTGGANFHSYAEFLPITPWVKSLKTTLRIIEHSITNQKDAVAGKA